MIMGKKKKIKQKLKEAKKLLKSFLNLQIKNPSGKSLSTEEIADCYKDQLPE